ncbi:hypothetical protein ACO1O0_001272 [Amphichorda felina]
MPTNPTTPDSRNSETPWLDWKHGEAVSQTDLDRLELRVDSWVAPEDWTFVRHKIASKIRCATRAAAHCDLATQETSYVLYNSPCTGCTGHDRCTLADMPYKTHIESHTQLLRTEEQHQALDRAVKSYWSSLMRLQTLCFRAEFGDFPVLEPYEGLDHDSTAVLHFFSYLTCTECPAHIRPFTGEPTDCNRCNNVQFPVAHNPLRALFQREARTNWANRSHHFTRALGVLEGQGSIGEMQAVRLLEHDIQQDWMAMPTEQSLEDADADAVSLRRLCDRIKQLGPEVEDAEARGHAISDWNMAVDIRLRNAKRLSDLIHLDPGLSTEFRKRLSVQVHSMLLPWPRMGLGQQPLLDSPALEETKVLVSGIDQLHSRIDREWWLTLFRKEAFLKVALIQNDSALLDNSILADGHADGHLDGLNTIKVAEARESGAACSICSDEWIESADLPPHLRIVKMPCCGKPCHRACIKRELHHWFGDPKCPMCSTNLTEKCGK